MSLARSTVTKNSYHLQKGTNLITIFLEDCYLDDTADDSITVNNFPQEAVLSFSSHFFNTILQHSILILAKLISAYKHQFCG